MDLVADELVRPLRPIAQDGSRVPGVDDLLDPEPLRRPER
jgi:hypothetical protein